MPPTRSLNAQPGSTECAYARAQYALGSKQRDWALDVRRAHSWVGQAQSKPAHLCTWAPLGDAKSPLGSRLRRATDRYPLSTELRVRHERCPGAGPATCSQACRAAVMDTMTFSRHRSSQARCAILADRLA